MTEKKSSSKAKAPAKRASTPRKTAKTIRNLRGTVVHLRLYSQSQKDPYRIELKPRGTQGDITTVPANLASDPTLTSAIGVLVEVITTAEANALRETYAPVGYLGRSDAPVVVRPEDTTVSTADDWDGTGRRAPVDRNLEIKERGSEQVQSDREFGTGMHTTDIPGADHGLHATLKAGQDAAQAMGSEATPEGVDVTSRRVVIERVKGQ